MWLVAVYTIDRSWNCMYCESEKHINNCEQSDTYYEFVIDFNLLIPCNSHLYKGFHFINCVTLVYVIKRLTEDDV